MALFFPLRRLNHSAGRAVVTFCKGVSTSLAERASRLLQSLRFRFERFFRSLGKYNADGLAENFEAENFCGFISSFQLSYMGAKTIL